MKTVCTSSFKGWIALAASAGFLLLASSCSNSNVAICGDGVPDPGETCGEPGLPACPTNCDDGNPCTSDLLTGSAENCNASCSHSTISQCQGGDGCCPAGCNSGSDTDCTTCVGLGETYEDESGQNKCCSGLVNVVDSFYDSGADFCAVPFCSCFVCTACGTDGGVCSANENICNCPQDCYDDAFEPDDTCQTAQWISVFGSAQQHTFHKANDADWVYFTCQANVTYTITVDNGPLADAIMLLYGSCGKGTPIASANVHKTTTSMTWTAPADGPYYLKLINNDPNAFGHGANYSVRVTNDFCDQCAALHRVCDQSHAPWTCDECHVMYFENNGTCTSCNQAPETPLLRLKNVIQRGTDSCTVTEPGNPEMVSYDLTGGLLTVYHLFADMSTDRLAQVITLSYIGTTGFLGIQEFYPGNIFGSYCYDIATTLECMLPGDYTIGVTSQDTNGGSEHDAGSVDVTIPNP